MSLSQINADEDIGVVDEICIVTQKSHMKDLILFNGNPGYVFVSEKKGTKSPLECHLADINTELPTNTGL